MLITTSMNPGLVPGLFQLLEVLVLLEKDTQIGQIRRDDGRIHSGGGQGAQPVDQLRGAGLFGKVRHPADVVEGQDRLLDKFLIDVSEMGTHDLFHLRQTGKEGLRSVQSLRSVVL